MYLGGYLEGPIKFRFPDNHEELLNPGDQMAKMADFFARGAFPKRDDNTNYDRSQILGGELFDGCPADVILNDGRWSQAQIDAIQSNPAVRAAVSNCRYFSSAVQSQGQPAPQQTANNAPAAGAGGTTMVTRPGTAPAAGGASTVVYTPTGVATPIVVTWPGGGSFVETPQETLQAGMPGAGGGMGEALPIVAGLLLLGFFFSGRKGRGA